MRILDHRNLLTAKIICCEALLQLDRLLGPDVNRELLGRVVRPPENYCRISFTESYKDLEVFVGISIDDANDKDILMICVGTNLVHEVYGVYERARPLDDFTIRILLPLLNKLQCVKDAREQTLTTKDQLP